MVIGETYPPKQYNRVLLVCGPGNNGGDGLVCCRHLVHFGFKTTVVYPKPTPKPLFQNLVTQCKSLSIPFQENLPENWQESFDLIVDAIFGYSFKGEIRAPFDTIIKQLRNSKIPVVSVDIPSGWDVEQGDVSQIGIKPDTTISLTAAKLCMKNWKGKHFLGGRFVPPHLAQKYGLNYPPYVGTIQFVSLNQ